MPTRRCAPENMSAQVWISYAQFEAKTEMETARGVFRRGYDHLRRQGLKEERWVDVVVGLCATHFSCMLFFYYCCACIYDLRRM